jgi:glycosyltransferase involved in cell wall biosynthesis
MVLTDVDVLHLCYRSPLATGSYNREIPVIVNGLKDIRQKVLSSRVTHPVGEEVPPWLLLRGPEELPPLQRAVTRIPARLRTRTHPQWAQDSDHLAHTLLARQALIDLRPALAICYDDHKTALQLRSSAAEGTRIGFSQHGFSYFLNPAHAASLYSLQRLDFIITLSSASYRFERSRLPSYEPRVHVVGNAVDTEFFRPPSPSERHAARRSIVTHEMAEVVSYVGRLVPKKGVHILLQAWHEISELRPRAILCIAGDGPNWYRDELLATVNRLRLRGVYFLGRLHRTEVRSLLWSSSLYVLPTLCREGFPLSLIEAMACGSPAICGDFPASRELLGAQAVTVIQDPNDPNEYVRAVPDLLTDRVRLSERSDASRALAVARFSHARWLDQLESCYRSELPQLR